MKRFAVFAFWMAALGGGFFRAAPAVAQEGFLFEAPRWQLSLKGGYAHPSAGGDVFEFLTTELTLQAESFRGGTLAGELTLLPFDRVGFTLGLGHSVSDPRSETRHWIGSDGLPIEQVTRLRITPLTVAVRYYLRDRGRMVGRLAWLPTRTLPYVGVGTGVSWYRLAQSGEFVDFVDDSIFQAYLASHGSTVTYQALAGVEHWWTPRVGLLLEARYVAGRADTSAGGFSQLDSLDLGGISGSAGFTFRW